MRDGVMCVKCWHNFSMCNRKKMMTCVAGYLKNLKLALYKKMRNNNQNKKNLKNIKKFFKNPLTNKKNVI